MPRHTDLESLFEDMVAKRANPGWWYLIPNDKLIRDQGGRKFSGKVGHHPCIVVRQWDAAEGDRCAVVPRSSTGGDGIPHARHHPRHGLGDKPCGINVPAHVVVSCRCSVDGAGMAAAQFSCIEPTGRLRDELRLEPD